MGHENRCACPCCGLLTLPDRGHYEICRVCDWEDDPIQSQKPDFEGGANAVSLNQARRNYAEFGTSDPIQRRES
ncbi:CPCC family cysteine-rich protein [Polyangium sorediatum]|uniref:CPCC family cysteine-rich protein n=1 Tax=Polyangium sorediatum TaxID=889274 RepID=UPI0010BD37D5